MAFAAKEVSVYSGGTVHDFHVIPYSLQICPCGLLAALHPQICISWQYITKERSMATI
jgi:hypothetical protein